MSAKSFLEKKKKGSIYMYVCIKKILHYTGSLPYRLPVKVFNEEGKFRVVSTKDLPGDRWLEILKSHNCRVEVCTAPDTILSNQQIKALIGSKCDGVIGQLTEDWGDELFSALKQAGGKVYSNYAVGYNNVKVPDATKNGIAVGNTPGRRVREFSSPCPLASVAPLL